MTGATLDTGALIALESGSTRMAVLVGEALAARAELAVPAGRAALARLTVSTCCWPSAVKVPALTW